MGKKILSIEIGLHTTKVCEVEAGKKNPHVSNCITFDTPDNIVEDGYILDKELMAQTLRSNLAKAKMNSKDVNITIVSTKIANREVVIPSMPESKIQAMIDTSASEYFPLDVSEYTISYSILDKINTKEEKKIKLLLLAAPNNLIKNIYAFAEIAGLKLNAIDYIGNSVYQVLKKQVGSRVNVSVQINEQTTLVNVIENEKLALQRTIPYGAMNVVSAVLDNSIFGKTNARDAMQLLMQENIINARLDMGGEVNRTVPMASDDYDRVMRELRGREDVTNTIQYIMNNVNRVLDYFMSRNSDKRINAIYLTGVGAKFKGIEVLFTNETGYDVKKIDNLFSVSFAKGLVSEGEQADYLTAIGASIAPIGFVPEDVRGVKGNAGNNGRVAVLAFGGVAVVAVLLCVFSIVRYGVLKNQNSSLLAERDDKAYILAVYQNHYNAKNAYGYTHYMYNLTSGRNYQLTMMFEELQKIMPSNMKVTALTSDTTSLTITIDAKPDKLAIASFIHNLEQLPNIVTANVLSIQDRVDEDESNDQQVFTVICQYQSFDALTEEKVTLQDEINEESRLQAEEENAEAAANNTDEQTDN
ncbi:MAG: pilus assembly protein PilM [Lachnospiraceae bacterium]|nr:pilus assembly protein PilM [Lachnospiraceae bacterium]